MDKTKVYRGLFSPSTMAIAFIFLLDNITVQGLAFFLPTYVHAPVNVDLCTVADSTLASYTFFALQYRPYYLSWKNRHLPAVTHSATLFGRHFHQFAIPLLVVEVGQASNLHDCISSHDDGGSLVVIARVLPNTDTHSWGNRLVILCSLVPQMAQLDTE
jgi:hypothetical protein